MKDKELLEQADKISTKVAWNIMTFIMSIILAIGVLVNSPYLNETYGVLGSWFLFGVWFGFGISRLSKMYGLILQSQAVYHKLGYNESPLFSKPKKMIGRLVETSPGEFHDPDKRPAVWNSTSRVKEFER